MYSIVCPDEPVINRKTDNDSCINNIYLNYIYFIALSNLMNKIDMIKSDYAKYKKILLFHCFDVEELSFCYFHIISVTRGADIVVTVNSSTSVQYISLVGTGGSLFL